MSTRRPGSSSWTSASRTGWAHGAVTGEVDLTTTYHPAEHALSFQGPATLSRGISVPVYGEFQDGNWIEYTSNCFDAPLVSLERRLDGTWEIVLELPTEALPEEWERSYVTVPPIADQQSYSLFTVVGTSALCFLDNLRLMQPEPDSGW